VRAIALCGAVLGLAVGLAGCVTMTPADRAAVEERERRRAVECEQIGRVYVSGACISRGGGA
jgi:hypothetical protein